MSCQAFGLNRKYCQQITKKLHLSNNFLSLTVNFTGVMFFAGTSVLCIMGFRGLMFLCRSGDVSHHSDHLGGAVRGGHFLDPGTSLGNRVHSRLHSVLCQVLYHRCDRAGGGRP